MDVAVVGFGPAGLYVASRLAAEGIEVALFGSLPDVLPEFVSKEALREFSLGDFVLKKISRFARFSREFELSESVLEGAVVDTESVMRSLLLNAVRYGADVLAGSTLDPGGSLELKWLEKTMRVEPEFIVMEESMGRSVMGAEVARIPTNDDAVEYYEGFGMTVLPAGATAVVYGNLNFSWHKFENAAVLQLKELFVPPRRPPVDGRVIRVGRPAGQVGEFGWLLESGLYYGHLLTESLLRYFGGQENALDIYRISASRGEDKLFKV